MSKTKLSTPGKDVVAKKSRISPNEERAERTRKVAAEAATMEDSIAAELKSREHGDKPSR